MPGRQRRCDAAALRRASFRPCRVLRQPARRHSRASSASSTSRQRRRSCCSCPATKAWSARCSVSATTPRPPRSATWRSACRKACPGVCRPATTMLPLPPLASVSAPIATAALKAAKRGPGATAGARGGSSAPVPPPPPPGWCATWSTRRPTFSAPRNSPSSPPRSAGVTALRSNSSRVTRWPRRIPPSPPSAAGRRDRRMSRSCAGPAVPRTPTRRSSRCAARVSASTPAATTSSRRAACCG